MNRMRSLVVVVGILLGFTSGAYGACLYTEGASGSCSSPRVIPGSVGQHVVLMDVSTATDTAAMSCGSNVGKVVYFSVTPVVSGTVTVSTCHPMTSYDTVVDVMTGGSGCEWFTWVGCNDDSADAYCDSSCSGRASKVTFSGTAGATYRIRVGSFNQNSAGCNLCLGLIVTIGTPCGEAPRNIVCQEAYELSGTPGVHEMKVDARETPLNTASWLCEDKTINVSHPVWFRFTPTVEGVATFTTCHGTTSYDTVVKAVSGCSGMVFTRACNDDMEGCGTRSEVSFSVLAGYEYFVVVGAYGTGSAGCLGVRLTVAECGVDGDCDDGNPCTLDRCGDGVCTNTALPNGTGCPDDGNQCTADLCVGGLCVHSPKALGTACGDPTNTDCTNPDTCNGAGVCLANHEPSGTLCTDDGNQCTYDQCNGSGTCTHPYKPSGTACGDDGNQCTYDQCNATGSCTHPYKASGTACGDPTNTDCTDPDTCNGSGVCLANHEPSGTSCTDDGNQCTSDQCNGTGSCTHPYKQAGTACGDQTNTACTDPDTCNASGQCLSNHAPSGTSCGDDGNPCTYDWCDGSGGCTHPNKPSGTACGDQTNTACTDPDTCNASGQCRSNHAPYGTPCPDSFFCNGAEICNGAGTCQPGAFPCDATEICNEQLNRCGPDCNTNGILDDVDIEQGTSKDCNHNLMPDECEPDADGDGVPDVCDLCPGFDDRLDADQDTIPDDCDICLGGNDLIDSDGDDVPDDCDECPGFDDNASIGSPFAISGGFDDSDPDVAFNSTSGAWLVVWAEKGQIDGTLRNMARRVDMNGTPLGAPIALSEEETQSKGPRVSYDPVGNEWVAVWSSHDPIEATGWRLFARRISANGSAVGTEPLLITYLDEETNPDVAAGSFESNSVVLNSFFLIVWEESWQGRKRIHGVHIRADADPATGLALANTPFILDTSSEFPASRDSSHPRIADPSPIHYGFFGGGGWYEQTVHSVVFQVSYDSRSDIFLVAVEGPTVRSVVRVTETKTSLANETVPAISYNSALDRGLVVFIRGSQAYGQYLDFSGSATAPTLLSDAFLLSSADQFSVDTHPVNERFFLGIHIPAGMEGMRLSGKHADTLFGNISGQDQPVISLDRNTGDCYLLAYRSKSIGAPGNILGRIHCGCWSAENRLPTADAGPDQESVYAGAPFILDGSSSSDPDGDPLVYRWSLVQGAGSAFVDPKSGPGQEKPSVLAPLLDPGEQERSLTFELAVDDLRSMNPFQSKDTVTVRIIPGNDPNPPVANAGQDQTVDEESSVQLNGCASSDPDGDAIVHVWQLINPPPEASAVTLSDPLACNPHFTAPGFAKKGGLDLVFKLLVISDRGGVGEDTVTIHVNDSINEWPVADAGQDLTVTEHSNFSLDASKSYDPNADSMTYKWEVVSFLEAGEEVKFIPPMSKWTIAVASVKEDKDITLRLTVSDGRGGSDSNEVTLHVLALPMQVYSYTPDQGSPGTEVTFTGSDLLSVKGVTFNGYGGTIKTRTDTQMTVSVPSGGKVSPPGGDFFGGVDLGYLRVWERPEVTTGPLVVQDGTTTWSSPKDFVISHAILHRVILTQGVNEYSLVRKKHTLFQVQLRTKESAPAPNAGVSGAKCYVTPSVGTSFVIDASNSLTQALPSTGKLADINQGINFFLLPEKLSAPRYKFKVVIENNGQDILEFESTQLSAEFTDVITPRIVVRPVVPFEGGNIKAGFDWNRWWTRFHQAREGFIRIYPVADADFVVGPTAWRAPNLLGGDDLVHLPKNDFFGIVKILPSIVSMHNYLDDWNDDNPNKKAMYASALIDEDLYPADAASGFGEAPRSMMAHVVKFYLTEEIPYLGPVLDVLNDIVGGLVCGLTLGIWCPDPIEEAVEAFFDMLDVFGVDIGGVCSFSFLFDGRSASILAHELGHVLGFVDPFSFNHNRDNITHCLYDEDPATATYLNALGVSSPVFNVVPPGQLLDVADPPKSLMSYAPGRTDRNVFFLPQEYYTIWKGFRKPAGFTGLSTSAAQIQEDSNGGAPFSKKLKVTGYVDLVSGEVTVVASKPLPPEVPNSLELSDSRLRIAFLDSQGQIIEESGFGFNIPIASELGQEPFVVQYGTFSVVRALPDDAAEVAIYYLDQIGWSRQVSLNPPSVGLLAPTGGEHMDTEDEFTIRWTAQDPDGDALTFSVYYSPDGGATYMPLITDITETELHWGTMLAQGTDNALIRVVASDGFNLGEAVSGPFSVADKPPVAFIVAPIEGARVPATVSLQLAGSCFDLADGVVRDDSAFAWSSSRDGALGVGRSLVVKGLSLGTHEIVLTVTVGGKTDTASVSIEILSDRDGDGVADEVEEAEPLLDPDNPHDAMSDQDGDGVVLVSEVLRFGTDPTKADTDGDGYTDGVEVERGSNPLDPNQVPELACLSDLDRDGDVDGAELALFVEWHWGLSLEDVAAEFGRADCPAVAP